MPKYEEVEPLLEWLLGGTNGDFSDEGALAHLNTNAIRDTIPPALDSALTAFRHYRQDARLAVIRRYRLEHVHRDVILLDAEPKMELFKPAAELARSTIADSQQRDEIDHMLQQMMRQGSAYYPKPGRMTLAQAVRLTEALKEYIGMLQGKLGR
jgi:hypothetical protein